MIQTARLIVDLDDGLPNEIPMIVSNSGENLCLALLDIYFQ